MYNRSSVKFLGHQISFNAVEPTSLHVDSIKNFPIPKTVKQLRRFLGMVNFHHGLIHNCSKITSPLSKLINSKIFAWSTECQDSFDKLKCVLASKPIVHPPNPQKSFTLTTDASGYAIGGVLTQEPHQVIGYFSRNLTKPETRF